MVERINRKANEQNAPRLGHSGRIKEFASAKRRGTICSWLGGPLATAPTAFTLQNICIVVRETSSSGRLDVALLYVKEPPTFLKALKAQR